MASCGRLKASLQDNMKTIQRFQPLTTAEPVAATRNNLGATIPRRLKKNKNIHIPECSILFPQYSEASKSLPFLPRFPAYIGCLQLLDSQ